MLDLLPLVTAILLLVAASVLGWILSLVGMPGNWIIVASAALYAWLGPGSGAPQVGWTAVVALAALAAAGEFAEFAAGMWGARRAGGSRRAALFALIGSIVGAIGGAAVGLPVPVLGSAVASIAGGALGALAGAAFAEHTRGESPSQSLRVGCAAFWGRLLGTGVKTIVATALVVGVLVALMT